MTRPTVEVADVLRTHGDRFITETARSMLKCFESAAPPQTRIAAEVTLIATSPAAALVSKHAQHGRLAGLLDMANQIVDARRHSVGINLHRRELRAK